MWDKTYCDKLYADGNFKENSQSTITILQESNHQPKCW